MVKHIITRNTTSRIILTLIMMLTLLISSTTAELKITITPFTQETEFLEIEVIDDVLYWTKEDGYDFKAKIDYQGFTPNSKMFITTVASNGTHIVTNSFTANTISRKDTLSFSLRWPDYLDPSNSLLQEDSSSEDSLVTSTTRLLGDDDEKFPRGTLFRKISVRLLTVKIDATAIGLTVSITSDKDADRTVSSPQTEFLTSKKLASKIKLKLDDKTPKDSDLIAKFKIKLKDFKWSTLFNDYLAIGDTNNNYVFYTSSPLTPLDCFLNKDIETLAYIASGNLYIKPKSTISINDDEIEITCENAKVMASILTRNYSLNLVAQMVNEEITETSSTQKTRYIYTVTQFTPGSEWPWFTTRQLGAAAIIGIIALVAIVVTLLVSLVARKKKMCCFKEKERVFLDYKSYGAM